MDKMTLRRIGWVGASLGLTSVLVGCNTDLQSDSQASSASTPGATSNGESYIVGQNGLTDLNGLNGNNGLNANNGLNTSNGLNANNGFNTSNGLGSLNGFNTSNGFNGNNGFNTNNGFNSNNGFNVTNGLNISNGLNTTNGLYPNTGYMTSEHGRMVVQYMARCALNSGDSLVKQDQNGTNFTFPGGLGLAPEYKTAGCNKDCSERISACMMAHINSSGTHIPLWMDSPEASVGWGTSPSFPTREGTYFGQLMLTNTSNNLDAYFCNGPGADQNLVPGRLGAQSGSVPYANAWPVSAGFDGACESSHVKNGVDHGNCIAHTTGGVIDGDTSCTLNGTTYDHPLTVWRGATYQAESAEGGAFINGTWSKGGNGFNASNCNTPGTNGCAIILDSANGMGKRIGFIGSNKGVKFTNVSAPSSTANVVIYYTLGDLYSQVRYLSFRVNNGAPQVKAFGGLQDWSHPRGASITLSGFSTGSNNTVYVTGDDTHNAPDLDWMEVVGTTSTLPTTGFCTPSLWTATASDNSSQANGAIDGDLTSRWSTGSTMNTGDYYQLDFGGMVKLSTIKLNNTQTSGADYAGTLDLLTSQDGVNFGTTAADSSDGVNGTTVLSFAQEAVRAIRIKVKTARSAWWSIGEVQTDCSL